MKVVKMVEDNPITGASYGAVETPGQKIKKAKPQHSKILNSIMKYRVLRTMHLRQKANKENNR